MCKRITAVWREQRANPGAMAGEPLIYLFANSHFLRSLLSHHVSQEQATFISQPDPGATPSGLAVRRGSTCLRPPPHVGAGQPVFTSAGALWPGVSCFMAWRGAAQPVVPFSRLISVSSRGSDKQRRDLSDLSLA